MEWERDPLSLPAAARGLIGYDGALVFDEVMEGCDDLAGDRAGLPGADDAAVELDSGDDFCRSAGEEAFVCGEEIVAGHHFLGAGESNFVDQFDHGLAGDAVEGSGGDGWGEDLATFDDEDVVARAFGDVALFVEHDAFFTPGLHGFDFGHDVVEVVEGFDLGAEGGRGGSAGGAGDEGESFFVALGRVKGDATGDDDDGGTWALKGVQAE